MDRPFPANHKAMEGGVLFGLVWYEDNTEFI